MCLVSIVQIFRCSIEQRCVDQEPVCSCTVSVVIPMYNVEKYADALLRSLSAQTLQNIEIICVNDGSTDETESIVKKHMEKDNRIKYVFQENAGAGAARNNGIAAVQGEFFICIDADDEYDANLLEVLYKNAKAQNADITVCRYRRVDHWYETTVENCGFNSKVPLNKCFSSTSFSTLITALSIGPVNKLYRSDFIHSSDIRYCLTKVANDNLFGIASLLWAKRIVCIPANLLTVHRFINPISISARRSEHLEDTVNVFIDLYYWMEKHKYSAVWKERMAGLAVGGFTYNTQFGVSEKYLDAIRELLEIGPWRKMGATEIEKLTGFNEKALTEEIQKQRQSLSDNYDELPIKITLLENILYGMKKIFEIMHEVKKKQRENLSMTETVRQSTLFFYAKKLLRSQST